MPDLVPLPGGDRWSFEVTGEGEGLVFLHGWGVDHRIWRQQVKFFSSSYRTVAIDLPGHGLTTCRQSPLPGTVAKCPDARLRRVNAEASSSEAAQASEEKTPQVGILQQSLPAISEGVAEVLEYLELRGCHVVASSFGGLVALALAGQRPGFFQSITFAGSLPKFVRTTDFPHGLQASRIEKLTQQLRDDYPSMVHVFFRSLFTRAERESRRYKWIQTFRRAQSVPEKDALLGLLEVLQTADLRSVLWSLGCPVLFVNGENDPIVPAAFLDDVQKMLPHARRVVYPNVGHLPFLIEPQRFNRTLEMFLEEQ